MDGNTLKVTGFSDREDKAEYDKYKYKYKPMTLTMRVNVSPQFYDNLLVGKACVTACGVVKHCQKCISPVDRQITCTECQVGFSLSDNECRGKNFCVQAIVLL